MREVTILRTPVEFSDQTQPETFEICKELNGAEREDMIELYVSGYGGDTIYASMIVNAMITCRGSVAVIVDGRSSSCHALVALNKYVENLYIGEVGVIFMIHDVQIALPENGASTLHIETAEYKKQSVRFYKELGVFDLLTKKEKAMFMYNQNIYISGEEMWGRLAMRSAKEVALLDSKPL